MVFRSIHISALPLVAVLALGSTLWAQSAEVTATDALVPAAHILTIKFKGKIGPLLSGSDPLGLDGLSGTVTIKANESLSPTKHTANSATYMLPAGAISVVAGSNRFKTTQPSKMVINLLNTADTLTLDIAGPDGLQVTSTTFLKAGSWTTAVLKHPAVFTPSPQKLTAAKTASGPGCKIQYIIEGTTSVLGFAGTGSNSATAEPMFSEGLSQ